MATADIDAVLKKWTDPETGSIHGASLAVVDSKGNTLYRGVAGTRTVDPTSNELLTADTLTWIASETKLATSVSVLQLVEKGLIGLDDDVLEVLPQIKEFKVLVGFEEDKTSAGAARKDQDTSVTSPPVERPILEDIKGPITLRQLLTHTSGMAYDGAHPLLIKWSAYKGRTENFLSGTIGGLTHPLVFQPGTSWAYGPGNDWAGKVVEALTGKDFETYQQDKIWGPLGAKSTTFHPTRFFGPGKIPPVQETGFRGQDGRLTKVPSTWNLELADALGGGGLWSTLNDYSLLLAALLQGGGPLLGPASVEELFRGQLSGRGDGRSDHNNDGSIATLRQFCITDSPATSFGRIWVSKDSEWRDLDEIDYSLAGTVAPQDVPGRRKKGSVNWGGLPNQVWWVDRESGVAAALMTQVLPMGDLPSRVFALELEEALYKLVDGQGV